MSKFIINGSKVLNGELQVSGSKNALFPLMAACLLTQDECHLTNVPEIKDKATMVSILQDLGVAVEVSDHALKIRAQKIQKVKLNELVGKLRGSIVLLGALLAREKKAQMAFPGGDLIGKRPIGAHLAAFEALGATTSTNGFIEVSADKLIGNKIVLEESSVTATENAILASVFAEGQTVIKLSAMEPHVQQLCEFLNLMGAQISGIGTTDIVVAGVKSLHGANISVIPDSNEAASFMALAAATKSEIKISKLNPDFLEDYILQMRKMNVDFEVGKDFVQIKKPKTDYTAAKIQCGLYPKLASDDVPALAVLATQSNGESLLYEWLYENRLGYIKPLQEMGAKAEILDPHRVKIAGVTKLHGAKITSYDIRMGITLIIAALVAEGQSEIDGIEHVDRGYENLESRLNALGADIKRID